MEGEKRVVKRMNLNNQGNTYLLKQQLKNRIGTILERRSIILDISSNFSSNLNNSQIILRYLSKTQLYICLERVLKTKLFMTLRFIGPFGLWTNGIIVYFTVAFLYYSILFCFQSSILGEEREEDAGKRENREKDHGKGKRVELSWF